MITTVKLRSCALVGKYAELVKVRWYLSGRNSCNDFVQQHLKKKERSKLEKKKQDCAYKLNN